MKLKIKTIIRIIFAIVVFTLVSAIIGFVIWAKTPLKSGKLAREALFSDSRITVTETHGWIAFTPVKVKPATGFIFYPGARVDPRAYAPIMRQIAEQGFLAVIVPVRFNLALFDTNAASSVIRAYPKITHWAVGGHSLGGVAAAIFAIKHLEVISGIAFWASYPVDDSLLQSNIQIVSISGTLDGLATTDKIGTSRLLLPTSTTWVPIEGGNHSGFGDYGLQPEDNKATISNVEQWKKTADATVEMLNILKERVIAN